MNKDFLYTLLDSMSVSGHEIPLQKKVMAEMAPHCDEIRTDLTGNVISILNPHAPFKVMLTAHIDEIGLVITQIQENGLLRVMRAGGVHPCLYPGHQVVVHGYRSTVYGSVVHSKALEKADLKVNELYIDIGARDAADARQHVREGDPIHLNTYHQELLNGHLAARAIDDRGCVFIILEALKRARELGCQIGVYAATTVGEETNMRGAHWAGAAIEPDAAIAVDVTFAQDYPGCDPTESGDVHLGKGPVICWSPINNKKVNQLLMDTAQAHSLPYQLETATFHTGTDADRLHFAGKGLTTAMLSLPLRYMHAPSEVCSLSDVETAIELLARFLCTIDENTNLDPFQ